MLKQYFFTLVVIWITVSTSDGERSLTQADRNCPYDYVDPSCNQDLQQSQQQSISSIISNSSNYQFLVSLQKVKVEGNAFDEACYNHFCAGTMIAPNLVLSAARCFTSMIESRNRWPYQPIYVSFYPQCRHQRNPEYKRIAVDAVYFHPDYQQGIRNADLAILTLLGQYVGETIEIDFSDVDSNTELQIVGYGQRREEELGSYEQYPMNEARIVSADENDCNNLLRGFKVREGYLNYSSMICGKNPEKVICGEDFGGPLLKADSQGLKQVGIAMWGLGRQCYNVSDTAPTLFTRLSAFKEWIDEMVSQHGREIRWAPPTLPPSPKPVFELSQKEAFMSFEAALQKSPNSWRDQTKVCSWKGVECRDDDEIFQIDLRELNLRGTLPPELSVVYTIERFDVSGNSLSGRFPEEYSTWSNLYGLKVSPQSGSRMCGNEGLSDIFGYVSSSDLHELPIC